MRTGCVGVAVVHVVAFLIPLVHEMTCRDRLISSFHGWRGHVECGGKSQRIDLVVPTLLVEKLRDHSTIR